MAGVYARGESKDRSGSVWRVDIYDTTYTGEVYTMRLAGVGSQRTYDGIEDKPMFTPVYSSAPVIYISVSEQAADAPIVALLADIPSGKEDQFYCLIYKDSNLWFAGMVLTDLCQYNDKQRYTFELSAKDCLNRLSNYDYPYDDAADIASNGWVSELDAIRLALQICGIERFYTDTDNYIGVSLNWHEVNAAKIKCSLVETRVNIASFIEDVDTQRPKRALAVIADILATYGASIRFEEGMWRITHIETQRFDTMDYEYYGKLGNLLSTETVNNEVTIGDDGIVTKDEMVHMYLPALYGVGETIKAESRYRYAIDEDITSPRIEVIPMPTGVLAQLGSYTAYLLKVSLTFIPDPGINKYRLAIFPETDLSYGYYKFSNGLFWRLFPATGGSTITVDIETNGVAPVTFEYTLKIFNPYYITGGVGNELTITTHLFNAATSAWVPWRSNYHDLTEFLEADKSESELSYLANNTTYNASSIFNEETLQYCDFPLAKFCVNAKQIYTGTGWQNSEEWAIGTAAASGIPQAELLCQQAIYFQRNPRGLIQGSFIIPGYSSLKSLVWRSKRYIFLNGTHDSKTNVWTGTWMEVLKQTSDVTNGPRNPYRNLTARDIGNGDETRRITQNNVRDISALQDQLTALTKVVNDLKQKSDWGAENWLIQNIDGVEELSEGQKQNLILFATADGLKLKYDTPE